MATDPKSLRLGRYVETVSHGETVRAFVPPPLPPTPPLDLIPRLPKLSAAERALGRLDGITMLLPNPELFLYMYVRKEAVLSSQIEGTQSSLSDLLRFEAEARERQPIDDIREVSNYVDAVEYGLERMRDLPLSLRLIREIHERVLRSGRGQTQSPGEFRRSQNWIGGTRPGNAAFVPPPMSDLDSCLDAFERFIYEETSGLPPLIKAALLHVQFETIHPFLDGNGRVGRLLITLYLCGERVLLKPLLYLSLYFKTNRATYYSLLQEVRERGSWETWIDFFLDAVIATANQAFDTATRIVGLFQADRARIQASSSRRIHEMLQSHPILRAFDLVERTGLTMPTVNTALEDLDRLGIVTEITGRRRNRVFSYKVYLAILDEGTQPIPVAS